MEIISQLLFMGIVGAFAAGFTYLGVAGIRRWAARKNMLDIPNKRSSHTRPMPRGGGLAIVAVVFMGIWIYALGVSCAAWRELMAFTFGGLLVAGISFVDDFHPLPFWMRLLVHTFGAGIAVMGIGCFRSFSLPGMVEAPLGWLGLPLSLIWIVGLTNAYNFMDGIDGIAGGQALVAGLGWAVLGWIGNLPLVGVMGLLMASASLGFLGHNWPPARIFMGDVGSAFIGYALAGMTVWAAQSDPVFVLAGIALIWPFIFDATLTFFRRLCRGEKVWAAHRSHLYQRLVITGLSHRQVSWVYIGLATLGTLWAIAIVKGWRPGLLLGMAIIPAMAVILWGWTRRREHAVCREP